MKTKLNLGKYTVAILLIGILLALPPGIQATVYGPAPSVKTLTYTIPMPLPGRDVTLPKEIPESLRPEILKAMENALPGQSVLVAAPEVRQKYPDLVQTVADAYHATIGTPDVPVPLSSMKAGCVIFILVVIVIIVAGVVISVVVKICKLIPPPATNTPPDNALIPVSPALSSTTYNSQTLDLQTSSRINTNWTTIATFRISTNGDGVGATISLSNAANGLVNTLSVDTNTLNQTWNRTNLVTVPGTFFRLHQAP